jgi:hypothetical protein
VAFVAVGLQRVLPPRLARAHDASVLRAVEPALVLHHEAADRASLRAEAEDAQALGLAVRAAANDDVAGSEECGRSPPLQKVPWIVVVPDVSPAEVTAALISVCFERAVPARFGIYDVQQRFTPMYVRKLARPQPLIKIQSTRAPSAAPKITTAEWNGAQCPSRPLMWNRMAPRMKRTAPRVAYFHHHAVPVLAGMRHTTVTPRLASAAAFGCDVDGLSVENDVGHSGLAFRAARRARRAISCAPRSPAAMRRSASCMMSTMPSGFPPSAMTRASL